MTAMIILASSSCKVDEVEIALRVFTTCLIRYVRVSDTNKTRVVKLLC